MNNIIKIIFLTLCYTAVSQAAVYQNWNLNEPNNSGDCGWMYSNGTWDDSSCSQRDPTICYDGNVWSIGVPESIIIFGIVNTPPAKQCNNIGDGYFYAAPFNAYENERARKVLAESGYSKARINLEINGSTWLSNANPVIPFITRWFGEDENQLDEPDNGKDASGTGNEDCVAMDRNGFWHDEDCSKSFRFICADQGSAWAVSDAADAQENLYSGEVICRNTSKRYTFEAAVNDSANLDVVNILASSYASSATYGDKFWVNVNDRLTEGTYLDNENRYFWLRRDPAASSEPNNFDTGEDCVERSGSYWNDVGCSSAPQKFACFHYGTGQWQDSTVTSSNGDDIVAGSEACQALGPFWTFWAPHTPGQNSGAGGAPVPASENTWFNINDTAVEGVWQANSLAYFWGKTDFYNRNTAGFYEYKATLMQPNNGDGNNGSGLPTDYHRRIPELTISDNEDCAVQLGDGSWHDVPCSTSKNFACYNAEFDDGDKETKPWRLANADQNRNIYRGEELCQELDASRDYHFTAPTSRQQQADLSALSGTSSWVNATDRNTEGQWQYNNYLMFWAANQPEATKVKNCAVLNTNNDSRWYAEDCSSVIPHKYLCYNSTIDSWDVAAANTISAQNGIDACATLNTDSILGWAFTAPDTFAKQVEVKLDADVNTQGIIWINASDQQKEGSWNYNKQTFWSSSEPNGGADQSCAMMSASTGLWSSENCTGTPKPYLCFNTVDETWAISTVLGDIINFSAGQNACEKLNSLTGDYLFYAPQYEWENNAAKVAIGSTDTWINANDRIKEGTWVYNEFLYWSAAALTGAPDANDCLTMNEFGYWQDVECSSTAKKVACYSGDGWYLTPTAIKLTNYSDGQRACDAVGDGYRFYAPTHPEHNRDLRALLSSGENVWINGIDIAEEGEWVFNSKGLPTPNWASTEPLGETDSNCAYVDANGLWFAASCSETKPLTCIKSDGGFSILSPAIALNNNFDAAHKACKESGAESFYAPTTFNQNEKLRETLSAGQAWVNVSDALIEARWALNIAPTANLTTAAINSLNTSPEDTIDGCAYLTEIGEVKVGACNVERPVTCYNGQEWRVSSNAVVLGNEADNGKLIRNAFAICQQEFSGEYTFAVPEAGDDIGRWELAQALALSGNADSWLNLADWFVKKAFSANMPYQNIAASVTDTSGCAYVNDQNDGWLISKACDDKAAHYACYDSSVWKLALADGTLESPGVPQDNTDVWDQSRADLRCRELFGQSYSFSAPITPREDARLQLVISQSANPDKNVWINYYANRMWALNGQQWFADRINTRILDNVKIDQKSTTEDCATLTHTAAGLELTDEICSQNYQALCFDGSDWNITTDAIQWNQASAKCGEQFDEQHVFAMPRDSQERSAVLAAVALNTQAWVNYSDLAVESKWRANLPLRQWWANNEPTNQGNRDCVVMDGTGPETGTWRSDYCDQVFHHFACKNGSQWQITTDKGIWAQGFSKCHELGAGWHFDYPEDYFANLNTATTLSGETVPKNDFDNGDIDLAGKSAWLNLTDQYREKDWQRGRQFSDWAANFAFDDNRDCAFVDTTVIEINGQSAQGTWQPGLCHSSDTARQYACTNGLNWALADAVVPSPATADELDALGKNWSDGFDACADLAPKGTWGFAAPVTVFDNQRLAAALGKGSAWINLQDVGTDGDWAANLVKPNLPPVIKLDPANENSIIENSVGNLIKLQVIDPEGTQINLTEVIDNNGLATAISIVTSMPCDSPCAVDITYTAPRLTNIPKALDFKLTAVDSATPANSTTTNFVANVIPPIIAWYDFDDANRTNYDKTGNGNDANDSPDLPYDFPPVTSGSLDFTKGTEKMTVSGTKLSMPANYAIAMRIRADGGDVADYQHFQIKYDGTNKCFDLPGQGAGAAVNGNSVTIYTCEDASDQFWYQDSEGLIHSVANDTLCLSHPGSSDLNLNTRNVQLSYCENVQHPFTLTHDQSTNVGSIKSDLHAGFYLYAANSDNNTNVVLANIARNWKTEKNIGRGILQKGPSNQPLLTFEDADTRLIYTVGNDKGTTPEAIRTDQWVNLVLNVNGTAKTLYVDGVKMLDFGTTAATSNTDDLIIGNFPTALRSFIGRIDDVQIFSRALSAAEVLDVLPKPPIGYAQFESGQLSLQEPQIEGGAVTTPVVVRRTDGSRGDLRVSVKTLLGSAKEGSSQLPNVDYLQLNGGEQILTWNTNGTEKLHLTPEYGLLPLLGAVPLETIDSVELNRKEPVFAAIDLTIPQSPTDARGVVWEQGGSGRGSLVAFDENHQLIVRAGSGQAGATTDTARLVVSAADVANKLAGKTGTLLVEVDPLTSSVHAWFKDGGQLGEMAVIDLGSATASAGFADAEWQGGDPGILGNINSDVVRGENFTTPFTTFNARYIRNYISGNSINGSVHWVEMQIFDAAGTNIALNKSVTASDTMKGGQLSWVTNNNLSTSEYADLNGSAYTERWVQVELGASAVPVSYVNVLHYYQDGRSYNDNKTEYSTDGSIWLPLADFTSEPYAETNAGKSMDLGVDNSNYLYNGTITSARFYNQVAPSPIERIEADAKLLGVTLYNEVDFQREPTEHFGLEVVSSQSSDADADTWVNYAEGTNGVLNKTDVSLLDYTKNPFGIFQFAASSYVCSEPHAGDNSGLVGSRYYRRCSVEVQRRTGDQDAVSVKFGVSVTGLSHIFADGTITATTDVIFDVNGDAQKLTFADGVRTQSIGFRVLAEEGSDNVFENNEKFSLTLFNPLNETKPTSPVSQPWLGDPVLATVVVSDYANGQVEMAVGQITFEEPLFDSVNASNNSNIETVQVRRSNGSDGVAQVVVSLTNETGDNLSAADYEFVDVNGASIAMPQTFTWDDGQQSSQSLFIKIKADLFEEYESDTQQTDPLESCYDVVNNSTGAAASGGDGISDDLDRNCYKGESLFLTVTRDGGDVALGANTTTRVFIYDNTAPALINFTAATQALGDVSESVQSATIDVNKNGIYDAGDIVDDRRINISIDRSNSYAEQAVWLYVRGVENPPVSASAAKFQGITTYGASSVVYDRSQDAVIASEWIRESGVTDEWKYLLRMPMGIASTTNVAPAATLTTNVDTWYQGASGQKGVAVTNAQLAAIVDGNTFDNSDPHPNGNENAYQVHPQIANGRYIDFAWANDYAGGQVKFYNRPGQLDRIDGSRMEFYLDGNEVHQYSFSGSGDPVDIKIPAGVQFDQMRLTFFGDDQNFREIEVNSTPVTAFDQIQEHSVELVILDNDLAGEDKRNVEFRIEPAGYRDNKVVHLGENLADAASFSEIAAVQIVEDNLPPVFLGDTAEYLWPRAYGTGMTIPDTSASVASSAVALIGARAPDQDWVNVKYEVAAVHTASVNTINTNAYAPTYWLKDEEAFANTDQYVNGTLTTLKTDALWLAPITDGIIPVPERQIVVKSTENGTEKVHSVEKMITVQFKPNWHKLAIAAGECLYQSGSELKWNYFSSCGSGNNYLWAAIPQGTTPVETYQLINKDSNECLYKNSGTGYPGFRECAGGVVEQWIFEDGGRSLKKENSGYVCGRANSRLDVRTGGCSWDDVRWQ